MLDASTTASLRNSKIRLKAGFSISAAAVRPGRDNEPVVSSGEEGFPRTEPIDGSSLDFIVWPFLSRLAFEDQSNTASADSCTARIGFRQPVPSFQASLTRRSDAATHDGYAGLPG